MACPLIEGTHSGKTVYANELGAWCCCEHQRAPTFESLMQPRNDYPRNLRDKHYSLKLFLFMAWWDKCDTPYLLTLTFFKYSSVFLKMTINSVVYIYKMKCSVFVKQDAIFERATWILNYFSIGLWSSQKNFGPAFIFIIVPINIKWMVSKLQRHVYLNVRIGQMNKTRCFSTGHVSRRPPRFKDLGTDRDRRGPLSPISCNSSRQLQSGEINK